MLINPISRRATWIIPLLMLASTALIAGENSRGSSVTSWEPRSPRDELRPQFIFQAKGGKNDSERLVIAHDSREGLDGYWIRTFPVQGGNFYRFSAARRTTNVAVPRRSGMARILWQDEHGRPVKQDEPSAEGYLLQWKSRSEAEHPLDYETDANGWTEVSDTYRAPSEAKQAVVELHGQWAPRGTTEWSDVSFAAVTAPPERKVRLASVHYKPKGPTPEANRQQYVPLIEEAARQHADLVVLGETITYVDTNLTYPEAAEAIPGPSTQFFGKLASEHNLYIVVGLLEREDHLVYNVGVLIGPDGKVAGKYRKVSLPRGEVEDGCAPGSDYPVFDTRFGKLGIMVCYDGFFPEVAEQLANRGAEVIAWPVWGCNPLLARARACDNQVYMASSTYSDISRNWMLSAVYDPAGEPIAVGQKFGTVVVAEVDLNQRLKWNSLGDFKGDRLRHRPTAVGEPGPPSSPTETNGTRTSSK